MIDSDYEAWDILDSNFIDDKGIIRPKVKGHSISKEEREAINHLCNDWDYGFSEFPK